MKCSERNRKLGNWNVIMTRQRSTTQAVILWETSWLQLTLCNIPAKISNEWPFLHPASYLTALEVLWNPWPYLPAPRCGQGLLKPTEFEFCFSWRQTLGSALSLGRRGQKCAHSVRVCGVRIAIRGYGAYWMCFTMWHSKIIGPGCWSAEKSDSEEESSISQSY